MLLLDSCLSLVCAWLARHLYQPAGLEITFFWRHTRQHSHDDMRALPNTRMMRDTTIKLVSPSPTKSTTPLHGPSRLTTRLVSNHTSTVAGLCATSALLSRCPRTPHPDATATPVAPVSVLHTHLYLEAATARALAPHEGTDTHHGHSVHKHLRARSPLWVRTQHTPSVPDTLATPTTLSLLYVHVPMSMKVCPEPAPPPPSLSTSTKHIACLLLHHVCVLDLFATYSTLVVIATFAVLPRSLDVIATFAVLPRSLDVIAMFAEGFLPRSLDVISTRAWLCLLLACFKRLDASPHTCPVARPWVVAAAAICPPCCKRHSP
jgi:hypothetical protein